MNNEAEYEVVLAGLHIAREIGATNKKFEAIPKWWWAISMENLKLKETT
jgi:hypothetical protein